MKLLTHLSLSIILLLSFSCSKFIEATPPVSFATGQQVFANDEMAQSAVAGAYVKLRSGSLDLASGGATVFGGLSADELGSAFQGGVYDLFEQNELNAESDGALNGSLWVPCYQAIYHANAIIEGLENAATVSTSVKSRLKGEMLTIRAFMHFYLNQFFGGSPLIHTTDFTITGVLPRSSQQDMFESIITDLEEAHKLLKQYEVELAPGRINRFAVSALLARAHLYQGHWEKASLYATEVIESNLYKLEPLNTVFLSGSSEAIWSVHSGPETGYNTAEALNLLPYDEYSAPNFYLKEGFLAAFESGDQRKQHWISESIALGDPLSYPYKYKAGYAGNITEHYVIIRLAELYLIRAEALGHLDRIEEAIVDVNIIRSRAALPDIVYQSSIQLQETIQHERKVELFAEWGHRWLDLKRWGLADVLLSDLKAPNWQSTDQLYPIPFTQIRLNSRLTQNPGYN